MACILMDGRAFTSKELAHSTGITPQTASFHLQILEERGIITAIRSGRNKYHRITNAAIASVIETLAGMAPADHLKQPAHSLSIRKASHQMRIARSCYDHIAGRLGVMLAESLCRRNLMHIENGSYQISDESVQFFSSIGIDASALTKKKRSVVRCCLDWTERRFHMAGSLASALMDQSFENDWLVRQTNSRALSISPLGYEVFEHHFSLSKRAIEEPSETEIGAPLSA